MENLDELLLSINAAVWHMHLPSRKFIYVNQHLTDICGITLADLRHDPGKYNELIHPDDKARVTNQFKQVKEGESVETEYRIITPSGIKWIYHKEMMLCDANGKYETLAGIISDVTQRKEAEVKLAESEKTYRYLFMNNPNPLWIYDLDSWKFLAVNEAAIVKYGYSREEFLKMTIADIRPPDEVERLRGFIRDNSDGYSGSGFWTHLKKDGTEMRVSVSSHNLIYENHSAAMVLTTDLTDILNVRDELDIASNNLKALINNTSDLIYSIDTNYRLISLNEAYKKHIRNIFNVTVKEGECMLLKCAAEHINDKWKAVYDRCLAGENFTIIEEFDTPTHKAIEEIRFNTMFDNSGNIIGATCFVHNITDQLNNARKIIEQNKKLREIAALASHDIRGHLASIMGLLNIFERGNLDCDNLELLQYMEQASASLDAVIHKIVDKTYEVTSDDVLITHDSLRNQSVSG